MLASCLERNFSWEKKVWVFFSLLLAVDSKKSLLNLQCSCCTNLAADIFKPLFLSFSFWQKDTLILRKCGHRQLAFYRELFHSKCSTLLTYIHPSLHLAFKCQTNSQRLVMQFWHVQKSIQPVYRHEYKR